MSQPEKRRNRALELVRAQLARKGSPHFILFIVLAATGLTGFLASYLLRAAGLTNMAIRYPVCVALAYLAFLFQLYLYVLLHRGSKAASGSAAVTPDTGGEIATEVIVDGGDVLVDVAMLVHPPPPPAPAPATSSGGGNWLGDWGGGGEGGGDDPVAGILILLVIVILVVVALAATAVILVEAPYLLAEVLVDGVLLGGMASRMQSANPRDWVFSVISRTALPAFFVAVIFALGGWALHSLNPAPNVTAMWQALGGQ